MSTQITRVIKSLNTKGRLNLSSLVLKLISNIEINQGIHIPAFVKNAIKKEVYKQLQIEGYVICGDFITM